MNPRRTFLTGMPGSGKSTTGKLISREWGIDFIDLDDQIEAACGMHVTQIFSEKGEDYFRRKEAEVLRQVVVRYPTSVIACGGGTPCFYNNIEVMQTSGAIIYIEVDPAEIFKRLEKEGKEKRPLLKEHSGEELIKLLSDKLKNRVPYYERARHIIAATGKSPEMVAEEILRSF
ncbi:shikimate kinase [Roseivirga sp. BDSF3-8]|uniref:shikimate kinase n=1 Tax=Roseivirga sp. BDSF3-8 TaxID=3241598 RepID=UPI0035320D2E